jgi:ABC-type transport system involved in multi-copper enzyme maturation permease subunit
MSARAVRLKKEARALFWPWCAVLTAGVLPFLWPNSYALKLNALSFWVGVPLLAACALGREFQQRTLSLWLTQPLSRAQLWSEKIIVAFAAAASAALVSGTGLFSFTWREVDITWKVAVMICVLVATAAAPYWTLASRSTIGGLAMISCYLVSLFLLVGKIGPRPGAAPPASLEATTVTGIFVAGVCCAGLMLWLGARKLAGFQVQGGSADGDLVMTGPAVMPETWAEWLRCSPTGPLANAIRKELRLLRPLWWFTALMLLYLACGTLSGVVPAFPLPLPHHPDQWTLPDLVYWAVFCTLGSFFLLLPVFAGLLSLGEERSSGTHAWLMTLPVSSRQQWLLKLAMALVAGFACAALLPLLVAIGAGSLFGSPLMFVNLRELRAWLAAVPVLTFASFWCACAANGTLRAALWLSPVTAAIFLLSATGMRLGQELAATTGTLRDVVLSRFHLSPLAFTAITDSARAGLLWLFVPVLLLALFQSHRLFRMEPDDSARWMFRCVAPLAAVTLLWSFSVSAGFVSSTWEPFQEIRVALEGLQPGASPFEVTGKDLAETASLTTLTRRWLSGSSIVVAPGQGSSSAYLATILLAGGVECRLTVARSGGTAASCVHRGR